jgi:hypothetical protein
VRTLCDVLSVRTARCEWRDVNRTVVSIWRGRGQGARSTFLNTWGMAKQGILSLTKCRPVTKDTSIDIITS